MSFSQTKELNYVSYHKAIIAAETAIFLQNEPLKGLKTFRNTFESFDFVFVDDCLEAFQLALFFNKEDYALFFIRKALANGFELHLLDFLPHDCPCEGDHWKKLVTIHKPFIEKHKVQLEKYASESYHFYLKRIDKNLLSLVIRRHVREQLFKNFHAGLSLRMASSRDQEMKNQFEEYDDICDDNLRFIDSLAKKKIFIGEQNLGIYTNHLAKSLGLPILSIEKCLGQMLRFYGLPENTHVPINTEKDYYSLNPLYNMLFHNIRSYEVLHPYKDEAIMKGYLHPREYASLNYNRPGKREKELYLEPCTAIPDLAAIDKAREQLLLPPYEVDLKKQQFAHQHSLKLFFGFRGYER
jgi:hypothetical protein